MNFTVNGEQRRLELKTTRTFADVMTSVYREFVNKDSVVTQVKVNGESLSEEQERSMHRMPMENIVSLEIQTKHPLDLANESMKTALDYAKKLTDELKANVRAIRSNDSSSGLNSIPACVDGLQWFFQMIQALKGPLHITGAEMITESKTFADLEGESASAIHEFCDARESGNQVALADAIEYELNPILEIWKQWLLQMTDVEVALRERARRSTN